MAKNARQLREEREAARRKAIREKADERIRIEKERKKEQEAAKEAEKIKKMKEEMPHKGERKSLAKAIGVKSTFVVGDKVYMTSFGKGNDAIVEKKVENNSSEDITIPPAFELSEVTDEKYTVTGGRIKGLEVTVDNPAHYRDKPNLRVRNDSLCLKPKLEERFYGKTFPDDNIHIQLIYNILDIEKILSVYSSNAVYVLNNILDYEIKGENKDYISSLNCDLTFEEYENRKSKDVLDIFYNFADSSKLYYFGEAFCTTEKNKTRLKSYDEIYEITALIAQLRQWCFHDEGENKQGWLYNLESLKDNFKYTLDDLYRSPINKINRNFIKTNKVNLLILSDIFRDESKEKLAKEYYDFLVTKKQKNMGFSIKHIREIIADSFCDTLRDQKYDSVRSKLYKLIDFVIYHDYLNDDNLTQNMVNKLRASIVDDEKEKIYLEESEEVFNRHKDDIDLICNAVVGSSIKEYQKDNSLNGFESKIEDIKLDDGSHDSYFVKLMYALTMFLSGKEINDLLTTLINKFDNIRSFNQTINGLKLDNEFTDRYSFFKNSDRIYDELVKLNSFARMTDVDVSAKKQMFIDALDILGIKGQKEEIEKFVQSEMLGYDANGKPLKKKGENGLRNFIINNVIDSKRFKYLIRYANPKKIRAVAQSTVTVRFVLDSIPESQIDRYYISCTGNKDVKNISKSEKVKELADIISNINFNQFKNADKYQKARADKPEDKSAMAELKRKNQAIIRIYLTVMYLLLKNLVNINARYITGFHCVERDAELYGVEITKKSGKRKFKNFRLLTADVMNIECNSTNGFTFEENPNPADAEKCKNVYLRKKKRYMQVYTNMKNSDAVMVADFRNSVAHFSFIRNINLYIKDIAYINSYFELYHYLSQKYLIGFSEYKKNNSKFFSEKVLSYAESVEKYHTYNKDFVKAYCVPMGYNIPRYKNLTINELFDMNNCVLNEKKEK